MKVILAGFSKTGTKTMADAFNALGYNTYDYLENFYYLYNGWMKIFEGKASKEGIRNIFEGVDAVTDAPTFLYWEELAEAFPEAKIVLTVRDEDDWYKSLVQQIEAGNKSWIAWLFSLLNPDTFFRRHYTQFQAQFFGVMSFTGYYRLHHEKLLRAFYNQHNLYMQKKVPKDRLLVFKMSDGWKPLCEFLGEDIPEKQFPHKNKKGDIAQEKIKFDPILRKMTRNGAIALSFWAVLTGYAGYRVYKCGIVSKMFRFAGHNALACVEHMKTVTFDSKLFSG